MCHGSSLRFCRSERWLALGFGSLEVCSTHLGHVSPIEFCRGVAIFSPLSSLRASRLHSCGEGTPIPYSAWKYRCQDQHDISPRYAAKELDKDGAWGFGGSWQLAHVRSLHLWPQRFVQRFRCFRGLSGLFWSCFAKISVQKALIARTSANTCQALSWGNLSALMQASPNSAGFQNIVQYNMI